MHASQRSRRLAAGRPRRGGGPASERAGGAGPGEATQSRHGGRAQGGERAGARSGRAGATPGAAAAQRSRGRGRSRRAAIHSSLELGHGRCGEIVHEDSFVIVGSGASDPPSASRARAIRERTVPTGNAERLRGVLVGEAAPEDQVDRVMLLSGESLERRAARRTGFAARRPERSLLLLAARARPRPRTSARSAARCRRNDLRWFRTTLWADAQQPRQRARTGELHRTPPPPRLQKDDARQILGEREVAGAPRAEREHRPRVALVELAERLRVRVRRAPQLGIVAVAVGSPYP